MVKKNTYNMKWLYSYSAWTLLNMFYKKQSNATFYVYYIT
jgi:hypothetical protein